MSEVCASILFFRGRGGGGYFHPLHGVFVMVVTLEDHCIVKRFFVNKKKKKKKKKCTWIGQNG